MGTANEDLELLIDEHLRRLGERVAELRSLQGLTLTELEDLCGVGFSQLSRLENGKINISVRIAVRVAEGLGVQLHELFVPAEMSEVRPKKRQRTTKKRAKPVRKSKVG